jgi:predicted DNA-binding transcriptional regulator AlpA
VRIVRYEQLEPEKGIRGSRSKIRRMVAAGDFPKPIPLDDRSTYGTIGWLDEELDAWIESRVKRRDAAK